MLHEFKIPIYLCFYEIMYFSQYHHRQSVYFFLIIIYAYVYIRHIHYVYKHILDYLHAFIGPTCIDQILQKAINLTISTINLVFFLDPFKIQDFMIDHWYLACCCISFASSKCCHFFCSHMKICILFSC